MNIVTGLLYLVLVDATLSELCVNFLFLSVNVCHILRLFLALPVSLLSLFASCSLLLNNAPPLSDHNFDRSFCERC